LLIIDGTQEVRVLMIAITTIIIAITDKIAIFFLLTTLFQGITIKAKKKPPFSKATLCRNTKLLPTRIKEWNKSQIPMDKNPNEMKVNEGFGLVNIRSMGINAIKMAAMAPSASTAECKG